VGVRGVSEPVLALCAGAVAGVLGSYAHRYGAAGSGWPAGVALALGLTAAVACLVHQGSAGRWSVLAMALGWFAAVTLAASPRDEGDLLVPGDGRGWSFLVGGTVVLGVALAVPGRAQARAQ
jgi:hypothetical protein